MLQDTYCVLRDTYCVLQDTYCVLQDTCCMLQDTVSQDTYCVARHLLCVAGHLQCVAGHLLYVLTLRNRDAGWPRPEFLTWKRLYSTLTSKIIQYHRVEISFLLFFCIPHPAFLRTCFLSTNSGPVLYVLQVLVGVLY